MEIRPIWLEEAACSRLRRAVLRLRNCPGPDAATELLRMVNSLPDNDHSRTVLEGHAAYLRSVRSLFAQTALWSPFVLHGAPLVVSLPAE